MWCNIVALCCFMLYCVQAKLASDEDAMDSGEIADRDMDELDSNSTNIIAQANISGDRDVEDSDEHIGPAVAQVQQHPYAGALQRNGTYVCSATVLNTYWSLTLSKCFDPDIISSYVTHKYLGNYTLRVGSSYNNKSGAIHKIRILINNFDLKVSALKLTVPLEYSARVGPVNLPKPDEEVYLGYLASVLAWTPNGHLRVLNAPLIDSTICEPATKLLPGHYVCAAGVQDPNRHFCRRDDGGAVIQNNTLVGIATFLHTCAVYTRTHAFPKVSSFARWLDSVIWDEENRPTVFTPTPSTITTSSVTNATENQPEFQHIFGDARKQMLSIPFAPISVPLEPAEDNSVLPRMSMYESYLQSIARARTSTTQDPVAVEEVKRAWLQKFEKKYNLHSAAQITQNNKYGLYP